MSEIPALKPGYHPMRTGLLTGIPLSGRPLHPQFTFSYAALHPPMCYNMNVMTVWMKPVDVARNEIAEKAVEMNAKYLFFIDEDVTPPGHALRQLIYQADHHPEAVAIGGIYCHKSPPAMPMIFKDGLGAGPYWDWKVGEFFEVDGISMGCTLIRVDALASIPKPWFKCYSADTEVLTRRGWTAWPQVNKDDEFATRTLGGDFEWCKAKSLTALPHVGQMINFKGEGADVLVTPTHRMYGYECRYDAANRQTITEPLAFFSAEDVAVKHSKSGAGQRTFRVPSTIKWQGHLPPQGELVSLTTEYGGRGGPRAIEKTVELKDWVAFLGIYLAEGSSEGTFTQFGVHKNRSDDARSHYEQTMAFMESGAIPVRLTQGVDSLNATRVTITQSKSSRYYNDIAELLSRLPMKFRPRGEIGFVVCDKALHGNLFPLGNKYIKHVPEWVKNLPVEYLEIFLHWFNRDDGSIRKNGDRVYFTTSKKLADDLQEMILKIGKSAAVRTYAARATQVDGRHIDQERTAPSYFIYERKADFVTLGKASIQDYDGMVYCATVPNEVLYVRRNGIPMWCGNTVDDASSYWEGVPKAEMWTEDLWFCDVARKAGWKVYADASVLCEHWSIETMTPTVLPPDCAPRRRAGWTKGTKKIVDLGCGENPYQTDEGDVLTVDIREEVNPDYRCDLRKLPFATGEFDVVYCMAEGSPVLTKDGFKHIEDVSLGDNVWTHKQRWRRVTGNTRFPSQEELFKVVTAGNPQGVLVTKNHPILTRHFPKRQCEAFGEKIYRETASNDCAFVEASELTRLHLSVAPLPSYVESWPYWDVAFLLPSNAAIEDYASVIAGREGVASWTPGRGDKSLAQEYGRTATQIRGWIYHDKRPFGYYRNDEEVTFHSPDIDVRIPRHLEVDGDLLRLLGYYLADGSLNNSGTCHHVGFHFNTSEWDYVNDVEQIVLSKFGIAPTDVRKAIDSEGLTIRYASKPLYDIIVSLVGSASVMDKCIPAWALWLEPILQAELVEGIYRGDGTVHGKGKSICTVSWQLAEGIRLLLQRQGHVASISRYDYDEKEEGAEFRGCGWRYHVGWQENRVAHKGGLIDSDTFVSRIYSVEKVSSTLPVYGLSVEEDESYFASGLMHHNSSHVLEHFPRNAIPEILDEWIRILKEDGEFRLIVPNIEWAAGEIMKGTVDNDVLNVLYGAQSYGENFHQVGFTPKVITDMLTERGFKRIDVELMHYNLCVRAWRKVPKDAPPPLGEVKVKSNGHKKRVIKKGAKKR